MTDLSNDNSDLECLRKGFQLLFNAYMTGECYGNSGNQALAIDDALRSYKALWPNQSVSD